MGRYSAMMSMRNVTKNSAYAPLIVVRTTNCFGKNSPCQRSWMSLWGMTFLYIQLLQRDIRTCVGCEYTAPLWSSMQSRALRDWEVLWCFKTTQEDESKALREERDGCGREQLSGSKAQPRELESFLLAVRNEGSSWMCGSDMEVQGSGGRGGRTSSIKADLGIMGKTLSPKGS